MELKGIVQNGVIVLSGDVSLPEGMPVTVSCNLEPGPLPPPREKKRVQLPLVHSGEPGSINLTNERIAEIFEEEEIAALLRSQL
jgi:hypothetical protein